MRFIFRYILSVFFVAGIFAALLLSLDLRLSGLLRAGLRLNGVWADFSSSILRVSGWSLAAWVAAILTGKLLQEMLWLKLILLPALNFIRHISPYAWLPFALIWFGLGEAPAGFILFTALYFPALVLMMEIFEQIPKEYLEEAAICGAGFWQKFLLVELPILKNEIINLFRILWGLGWTTVIAVEMLGVKSGLGFRLLDFRYLLQYENMVIYLLIMGGAGILMDWLLRLSKEKG